MCRFKDENEDEASSSCWCVLFRVHMVDVEEHQWRKLKQGLKDPKIFFQLHAWADIMICLVHA